jgi:hypothetical protein
MLIQCSGIRKSRVIKNEMNHLIIAVYLGF